LTTNGLPFSISETVREMTGLPKKEEKPSSLAEEPVTWEMKNP
jgi:hypothetical protein